MKLLEQTLSEAEQMSLVQRIVESQLFRRSLRLREMLTYLGEQSISRGRSSIREQEIGVAIFGRKDDYNTTIDNIVRVNASELRRRLERYFETEGVSEEYVVELPRGGGYGLHYFHRPVSTVSSSESERELDIILPALTLTDRDVLKTEAGLQSAITEPTAMGRGWIPLVTALCTVLVLICLFLQRQVHSLQSQLDPLAGKPQMKAFWGEFFESGRETDFVVGDNSLLLEQEILKRRISLDQYLSNSYRRNGADIQDENTQAILDLLHSHNSGGIADFAVVKQVLALSPRSAVVRFGSVRDYVPEEVRSHNLILVGSRVTNPWVDLFKDRLSFSIDRDELANLTVIHNRDPHAGEQAEYHTNSSEGQATVYSVVAYITNLDRSSSALLIGGTDSQGTKAAGDFLTSEQGLKQIENRLHGFPHFELLLRSSRVAGTTLQTEILALRQEQ